MMSDNKNICNIIIVVLFVLFSIACFPGISISADEAVDKKNVQQDAKQDVKQEVKKEVKEQKNPYADAEITIKIIPAANKTFGYDILLYKRPLVHQPNIPGLPGNEGFTTKERAQQVAEFVVTKIKKNEMPPTVSIDDLNNMGVLK
jgi:hypothetical protein